ncbi:hypothetical protein Pla110_43860 [Polystyrenella longa]|uniref:DUF2997 domain-containing protein n=1 Tax=Polystyrenella longa TaxID=2528007 RepID=A0A518CTT1_9PLAN|nr:DUF2997 domain-containing protein [Polystyrenella longa]QDU82625.1 hypothetical protein Pla110_43860 [Polystyrenella longa]
MKQIEIIVSPEGSSRVVSRGYQGSGCQEATRQLEAALGKRLTETLTPEFYLTISNPSETQQRQ